MQHISEDFRLGVVRGISYGLFGQSDCFIPQARELCARVVRAYFFWSQIEPRPGEYRWDAVDALMDQLDGDEEIWITLCSSSPWATRVATDFLPPSPANGLAAYAEFVRRTVVHCRGRVRYWQCDNEPSNTELLWAGTADEYLTHLGAFYPAVKSADATALVVLGGCGYDVLGSASDSEQR
jgi:Beta-galactosidase